MENSVRNVSRSLVVCAVDLVIVDSVTLTPKSEIEGEMEIVKWDYTLD